MTLSSWFSFLFRSVLLGIVISVILLLAVPELRQGTAVSEWLFAEKNGLPQRKSYNHAIGRASPSVVNIYSTSIDYQSNSFIRRPIERTGVGSGVIVKEDGFILTCYHVIRNAKTIDVGLYNGTFVEAQVVGVDVITDLAVLKISADNLRVIPQLDDAEVVVGDQVLSIGNPYNLGQTVTHGIVSRIGRIGIPNIQTYDFIQTDAVINEGSSGGALIDSNGFLVGINNFSFKTADRNRRVKDVDGVFFAIPYALAKRVMNEIIANGKASHGMLGFSGQLTPDLSGIYISEVFANGPAADAGLLVGDILTGIDGQDVSGLSDTIDKITASPPGTKMLLRIRRGGETFEVEIIVAAR